MEIVIQERMVYVTLKKKTHEWAEAKIKKFEREMDSLLEQKCNTERFERVVGLKAKIQFIREEILK